MSCPLKPDSALEPPPLLANPFESLVLPLELQEREHKLSNPLRIDSSSGLATSVSTSRNCSRELPFCLEASRSTPAVADQNSLLGME